MRQKKFVIKAVKKGWFQNGVVEEEKVLLIIKD